MFVYSIGTPIADPQQLAAVVGGTPGVAEASPVLFQHAVVTTETNTTGSEVMLKGIEPSRGRTSPMLAKIIGPRATFATPEGERGVAVGKYLAAKLGVKQGDAISVTVAAGTRGGLHAAHRDVPGDERLRHRLLRIRRALAVRRSRRGAGAARRGLGGEPHRGEARSPARTSTASSPRSSSAPTAATPSATGGR